MSLSCLSHYNIEVAEYVDLGKPLVNFEQQKFNCDKYFGYVNSIENIEGNNTAWVRDRFQISLQTLIEFKRIN